MDKQIEDILALLSKCSTEQKKFIFQVLRREFPIHAIEAKLNTQAEIILEAIDKDDTGLTFRMMRGVIAEVAFEIEVLSKLQGWKNITPDGDLPYDYLLSNGKRNIAIQVKLQRSKDFKPMTANQAYKRFSPNLFVTETQKTRGGIDSATKGKTRPYRYGQFDIIAVSMQPSTGNWDSFMYTVSSWLIPQANNSDKILKFQPVAPIPNDDWTDDFATCVKWLESNTIKTISS